MFILIVFVLYLFRSLPGRKFKQQYPFRPIANTIPRFNNKKPQWVTDKIIYIKALNPNYGCRKIAYTFNRLYEHKHQSVSKSFVYTRVKEHQYQILLLRRKVKHQHPAPLPKNLTWGMDLTTVTDETGGQNQLLAIIDYGTRKCLCFTRLESKHAVRIMAKLIQTIKTYGKPQYIKTDNEAVFTSLTLNFILWLYGITHQYSDVASPWQNGRIERLIGTFKERIKKLVLKDSHQLELMLPEFVLWYNCARPHNYLHGKTPDEAWFGEPLERQYIYWRGWSGLLTGYLTARL